MAREMESANFPEAKVADSDIGIATNREGKTLTADVPDQTGDTTIELSGTNGLEADEYGMLVGADGYEIGRVKSVNAAQDEATITREEDGTTSRSFEEKDSFVPIVPALTINQLRAEVVSMQDWMGADGDTWTMDRNIVLQPSTTDGTYPLTIDVLSGHSDPEPFINFRRSTDSGDTYSSVGSIDYDPSNDDLELSGFTLVAAAGSDILLEDGRELRFGTEPKDYWMTYNSGSTRWEFHSTDVDGGGSDGLLAHVADGGDAVTWYGDLLTDSDASSDLGASSTRWNNIYQEISHVDQHVDFTPIGAPTHSEGLVYYDSGEKALTYYNEESEVSLQVGKEMYVRVRNESGSTITDGTPVYVSGFSGGSTLPLISEAKADNETTARVLGLATHDIENNSNGYVTIEGKVQGIDTSSFSNGDTLYLSASSAGTLTTTEPDVPNYSRVVGFVARKSASSGVIQVTLQRKAHGLFSEGSIPFANSNGQLIQDNSNLYWDDTNDLLLLGKNTANNTANTLEVSGTSDFSNTVDIGTSGSGSLDVNGTTLFENDRDLAVDLLPNTDDTLDLGSSSRRFTDLYLSGNVRTGTSASDTYELQARDTNAGSWTSLLQSQAGNPPQLRFTQSASGNTLLEQTTADYTLTWNDPGAARTLTIPDPGENVDVAFTSSDLGNDQVAFANTNGNLESSTNLTWDGSTLSVAGTVDVGSSGSGSLDVNSTTLFENDRDAAVDLLPNASATLDLGSASRYWNNVFARTVQVENQGAGSDPTVTSNSASKRLLLGDELEITNVGDGANPVLSSSSANQRLAVTGTVEAFDVVSDSDATRTVGKPGNRYAEVHSQKFMVEAALSDNNPTLQLSDTGLESGPGGGSALDSVIRRVGTDQWGISAASSTPADADLQNSEVVLTLDETNDELEISAQYSDGTNVSGTVALS